MKQFLFSLTALCLLTSCGVLSSQRWEANASSNTNSSTSVTEAQTAEGLKSALNLGIRNAVKLLGVEDGFYKDASAKIGLPEQAAAIAKNISIIPGAQKLIDKAELALNRAAEDAVNEAAPIFADAITGMKFRDVMNILFGADNAATEYLKEATYKKLVKAFAPKVEASLGKAQVSGMSATSIWNQLSNTYNKVANTTVGALAGLEKIDVDLETYVTQKALDALFLKVAATEKEIREDPVARVSELLKRVFGQLD